MESAEKVRLVRCPSCDNVLPELPDYSVYQCGGCGVVLCAKGKLPGDKFVSARADEESNGAVGEEVDRLSGNSVSPLGVSTAPDIEPGISSVCLDQRQLDECVGDAETGMVENNVGSGKGVSVSALNANTSGIVTSLDGEGGGFKFRAGCESELLGDRAVSGWWNTIAGNEVRSPRNGYSGSCAVRYSSSKGTDEGPSDYNFASVHNTHKGVPGKHDAIDSGDGVRLLEKDRQELLRKLDELKNQLSQSYDVGTKCENIPLNGSTIHQDVHSPANTVGPSKVLQPEQSGAGQHNAGLPYFGQYPSSLPHVNGQDLTNNCDPVILNPNHRPRFCDHYSTQMHRPCPGQYDRMPPHGLISGQYLDSSCDPFGSVPTSSVPHQPSCSCVHRTNDYREASVPAPPYAFCRGHPNISPSKSLHYFDTPGAFGSSYDGPKLTVPSFNSHLQRPHSQRPVGINPNRFMYRRPQRVVSCGGGRRGRPIAGGAPFLACGGCFELLQLPPGELIDVKKGRKLRCGACNAVISYDLVNRKLVFSAKAEAKRATANGDDSSCEVIEGGYTHPHGNLTGATYKFSSDELGDSGYDCLLSDRARATSSGCVNLSLTNSQEMESISPSLSDQEDSPADLVDSEGSAQRKMNAKHSPLSPGSPRLENLDHSFRDHSSKRFSKGNRSSRSDHENVLCNKAIVRRNSLHDATLPAEVEMPFSEFSDNVVPEDSSDANRVRHQQPRVNKGESFLSNVFKKSFKDISRPSQGDERGKDKVFVNGHLIPDRSVKKAEKLAGPIYPGKYWYDFRAGFWGVMGGPCLGIIPPYIQELNYPLTGRCSGGNTGVLANGRELHQKDLDLLASRGLPLDRDRSYIIELSGRVYDEDTGEELDCLGKLAPTVEKVRHGFGMRVPKPVADA